MGGGQRLLVRTRQAVDRKGFVVAAGALEQPGEIRPAVGQSSPRRSGPFRRRRQFDQQVLRLAVRGLRIHGLSDGLEQNGKGRQAVPRVSPDLRVGREFGRQRQARGNNLLVCRQRVHRLADLFRQPRHFEIRLPERRRDSRSDSLPSKAPSLP